jgi:hypothetical protein
MCFDVALAAFFISSKDKEGVLHGGLSCSHLHLHWFPVASTFFLSVLICQRKKEREKKKKPPFETLNFAFVAIQTKNWKIDLSGNTIKIVV